MTIFTRFAPNYNTPAGVAETVAEALAPVDLASGLSVAGALSRGFPSSITNIGFAKVREFENTFSPSAVVGGPAGRLVTTLKVGDVVRLFNIPANHVVLAVRLEVVIPSTTTGASIQLTDAAGVLGAVQLATAAGQQALVTPKVYTVDTAYSLTISGAIITDGVYRVVVLAMDMTGQDSTTLITG